MENEKRKIIKLIKEINDEQLLLFILSVLNSSNDRAD